MGTELPYFTQYDVSGLRAPDALYATLRMWNTLAAQCSERSQSMQYSERDYEALGLCLQKHTTLLLAEFETMKTQVYQDEKLTREIHIWEFWLYMYCLLLVTHYNCAVFLEHDDYDYAGDSEDGEGEGEGEVTAWLARFAQPSKTPRYSVYQTDEQRRQQDEQDRDLGTFLAPRPRALDLVKRVTQLDTPAFLAGWKLLGVGLARRVLEQTWEGHPVMDERDQLVDSGMSPLPYFFDPDVVTVRRKCAFYDLLFRCEVRGALHFYFPSRQPFATAEFRAWMGDMVPRFTRLAERLFAAKKFNLERLYHYTDNFLLAHVLPGDAHYYKIVHTSGPQSTEQELSFLYSQEFFRQRVDEEARFNIEALVSEQARATLPPSTPLLAFATLLENFLSNTFVVNETIGHFLCFEPSALLENTDQTRADIHDTPKLCLTASGCHILSRSYTVTIDYVTEPLAYYLKPFVILFYLLTVEPYADPVYKTLAERFIRHLRETGE